MDNTSEINKILGELQQEIQNIRDSELVKHIKPFADKTSELVNKIESINFPEKLGIINNNLVQLYKKQESLDEKFSVLDTRLSAEINSVKEENKKQMKFQNILLYLIILLTAFVITLKYIG